MIMLAMPKTALMSAPAPIVKKWCSHTQEGDDADRKRREDHRAVAEQRLAGEGRGDLGVDPERRQDEDVDLRMPPDPDQVHVEHRVAAAVIREEVEAEVTVEHQLGQGDGQHRECGEHDQVGGKRRPAEDRHAQVAHARARGS